MTFDPDWVVRPGELLREEMETNHLSVRMVARLCRVDEKVIEGVLTGRRRITPQIARGLSAMGASPQFWLNFDRLYRDGLKAGKRES